MFVSDHNEFNRYYNALLERDPQFLGSFYVGVKTTGIFCISTCRARKPKPENVEFFTTSKELLQHGYRPCKICKPTKQAHEPPPEVIRALDLLKSDSLNKVRDQDLRDAGLVPETIRRWFKKYHGMTFQAYQRMIRINTAFRELKEGNSVSHSAFESGYDSLSGFGYTFKNLVGTTPEESINKNVILISRLTTPLGPMFVCATENGICLLEFTDRRMLETEFADLQKRLNAVILAGENEHTKQLKQELDEYFKGNRTKFDVPLETPGTEFQNEVWAALHEIPSGETRSYQEQADTIGNPKAVRAVARANGMNRIAIVIPCHRVIGKDGSLTGYAGGLERKRWLLEHESN